MSLLLRLGAYARDKNTSARLCSKNAGGRAYLWDTTVQVVYMLKITRSMRRIKQTVCSQKHRFFACLMTVGHLHTSIAVSHCSNQVFIH